MSKLKVDLDSWSEAETDLNSAKEVIGMLSHQLFLEGNKQSSDVAYAAERLIESALSWIDSGRYR